MYLEVNFEYPVELHTAQGDFPLAPERYNVCYDELRPINKFLYQKMENGTSKTSVSEEKLIPTFHERKITFYL